MLIALLVPICLLLALLAQPLVELLYSAKSLPAAPILVWLVVLGGLRVVYGFVVDLLMAHGRTVATFRAQLIWLLAAVPAMWIGADLDGARGVAIGHVVAAVVVAGPIYTYDAWRVGIDLGSVARRLVRPGLGAVASIALAAVVLSRLDGPVAELVVGGAAISVSYALVGLGPTQLRSFAAMLRRPRPAGAV
jgi:PST family polysaccharide transporter